MILVKFSIIMALAFVVRNSNADSMSNGEIHQKANWLGELYEDKDSKKILIQVIYQLRNTALPESTEWTQLNTPLKINLIKKGAVKEVKVTRYQFSPGCDSFPTYELSSQEIVKPKEWSFAAPENKSVHWAEDNVTFAKTKDHSIGLSDIPDYEWERLYDKLAYAIITKKPMPGQFTPEGRYHDVDLSNLKKNDLITKIRKSGVRKVSSLRTDKFLSLTFADLEFYYKGPDQKGRTVTKSFSIHRAYRNSPTGGLDEVATPYASGHFWNESYSPNQPTYLNTVDGLNLVLRINGSLQRSLLFLTNFHGVPLEHTFNFGREDCD